MADSDSDPTPTPAHPTRFWQWLLVYPALAIAVLTALPTIFDKGGAAITNYFRERGQPAISSLSDAQLQKTMWQRNLSCNTELHSWQETRTGIKVDATICPDTGDVLVQALAQDHRQHAKWISAKDQIVDADGAGDNVASIDIGLSSVAHAAEIRRTLEYKPTSGQLLHRVQMQNIICQRQLDGRTLLRRISSPQGCFDILIDMFTGQITRQAPAPCVPQC